MATRLFLPEDIRYYIVRSNIMTPMVPVDQLPLWLQLEGIPRQLTHRQRSDEEWKFTCDTDQPATSLQAKVPSQEDFQRQLAQIWSTINDQGYKLEEIIPADMKHHFQDMVTPTEARGCIGRVEVRSTPPPEASPQYLAPDHLVRSEAWKESKTSQQASHYAYRSATIEEHSGPLPESRTAKPDITACLNSTSTPAQGPDALRFRYRTPYPSGIAPDQTKKEYCTYWIKTGSCEFTQIGCKYKHEMPSKEKLQELGFRQTPMWYKEKPAVRFPTWMEERRAASRNPEHELPRPRDFPDPSSWMNRFSNKNTAQTDSTPQERPSSNTPEKTVSTSTTPPEPQDTTNITRSAFVDDLIDMNDDTDRSTKPQVTTDVNPRNNDASFNITLSSSQISPTPPSVTGDTIDNKMSPGDAPQGNNKQNTDPRLIMSREPDDEHDTKRNEPSSIHPGADRRPARPYCKAQVHIGLAFSKYATARTETPTSTQAYRKPAASSTTQPVNKDAPAVVKTSRPTRGDVKRAKKVVVKGKTIASGGIAR